jgi:hypothetical protein
VVVATSDTDAIDALLRSANGRVKGMAEGLHQDGPAVEAYVEASVPLGSGAAATSDALDEIKRWVAAPNQWGGTGVFVDTTTIVTLTSLLGGADRMSCLTLWDLSRITTAIVCFDRVFHLASSEIDDQALNALVGPDVFCPLELPSIGPDHDSLGIRGLFNTAWWDTRRCMQALEEGTTLTGLEPREIVDLVRQWSTVLGRPLQPKDVMSAAQSSYSWNSAGNKLLRQLWKESGPNTNTFDAVLGNLSWAETSDDLSSVVEARRAVLQSMIRECNYRGRVNERIAGHLQLPYLPNTARLPFRNAFFDQPRLVTSALPTAFAMDAAYAERSQRADLIQGEPLVLPVFLALAVKDAAAPDEIWPAIKNLREKASAFRERRAELDHSLQMRDPKALNALRRAIGTESETLTKRLGGAALAAGGAALTSVAADPVAHLTTNPADWVKTGLAAAIAGSRKMLPLDVTRRLVWRLCRPELRFMSDITMDSRAIGDSLPAITRLWGLSLSQVEQFSERLEGFRAIDSRVKRRKL